MYKKKLFSLLILCPVFFISCENSKTEKQATVSVSAIGTALARPDMARMHIAFSHAAGTTNEAKQEVDEKMRLIFSLLADEKIEEKDIKTIALSYDEEFTYKDGYQQRTGQRARQTISVTIKDIINNPDKFPVLLDKLAAIDKVEIRNISFDTENKVELFRQSRELAYQKALDKASQYAALSGRVIGNVLTISEVNSYDGIMGPSLVSNVAFGDAGFSGASSSVPGGEQGITSEINVTFLLKRP